MLLSRALTCNRANPALTKLRRYALMYVDNKPYIEAVYGDYKTAFWLVDVATTRKYKIDIKSKTDNGLALRRILSFEGVHKLPYKCTVCSDNCGSMVHVINTAVSMGLNYEPTPPWEPNLNPAEAAINQMYEVARTLLAAADCVDSRYLPHALDHACYVNSRMATTPSRGFKSPYELIKGEIPTNAHLQPFMAVGYANINKLKLQSMKAAHKKAGAVFNPQRVAQPGLLLGYHSFYSATYKLLLASGEIVHSRSVTVDASAPLGRLPASASPVQVETPIASVILASIISQWTFSRQTAEWTWDMRWPIQIFRRREMTCMTMTSWPSTTLRILRLRVLSCQFRRQAPKCSRSQASALSSWY